MLRKLIVICFIISLFIPSKNISACAFDAAIPSTKTDEFIESYYYELDFEKSNVDLELYQFDQNYLYVVQTKNFIYVEGFLQDILGIYPMDGTQIQSIEQSTSDQHVVVVTFNNGDIMEINSLKQNDNESNAIYLDSSSQFGYAVKEEYMYMYEEEIEELEEEVELTEEIKEEESSSVLIPIVTVSMLFLIPFASIKYVNRKGDFDETSS